MSAGSIDLKKYQILYPCQVLCLLPLQLQTPLDSGVTIGQFVSPGYQYFRLHPTLVQCYSDVVNQENKRRKDGGKKFKQILVHL